ncbi:MAG: metallophosphoesterase [Armatimonadota bacterium]
MIALILAAATALYVMIVVSGLLMTRSGRVIETTHLQIRVPGLASDLIGARVVMLSDLHVGRLHVPVQELLAAVDRARPDLLLLGGDYVAHPTNHRDALELVARLSEGRVTFGVPGNTDHHQRFDHDALAAILRASGGGLLINGAGRVGVGAATIEVLGVDDPLGDDADVEATRARAGGCADLRIGLCHSPALWQELPRLGAHITLVGHTHGGQVRFPGREAHFTHTTYPRKLAAGLFRYERGGTRPARVASHWEILDSETPLRVSTAAGPLLYVTRGVGMGDLPLRLNCPPELVLIEMQSEEPQGGGAHDG